MPSSAIECSVRCGGFRPLAKVLPLMSPNIRDALKVNIQVYSVEHLHGQTLSLLEIVSLLSQTTLNTTSPSPRGSLFRCVICLRQTPGDKLVNFSLCGPSIGERVDEQRRLPERPQERPFKVLRRQDQTYVIDGQACLLRIPWYVTRSSSPSFTTQPVLADSSISSKDGQIPDLLTPTPPSPDPTHSARRVHWPKGVVEP
ncbi:hypothetical protein P879_08086 [Paragonimus westermani]|uniref:Uncharacterized protein n=1 Tax=Paragonimus westermani TaxID=34504 RepID=A0A8T0DPQ9_9TREM|nr:hypothetical protein P879_08086 [Paragonimus westermani]